MERRKITAILRHVEALERDALETELQHESLVRSVSSNHLVSARNLLHYLAIRKHELRPLQKDLASMAISSQSHAEGYTLNNIQKIK